MIKSVGYFQIASPLPFLNALTFWVHNKHDASRCILLEQQIRAAWTLHSEVNCYLIAQDMAGTSVQCPCYKSIISNRYGGSHIS